MIQRPYFGSPSVNTSLSTMNQAMADAGITPPQYSSVLDAQGNLPDYLQVKNNYDSTYLNQQKAYVEGGESPWLKAQQAQIADQGAESLGALGAQNASGLQEAEQGLAMRRGLTGGASERLQELGDDQAMFQRQNINRGMVNQNLAATATEEADKQIARSKIPGLEFQKTAYDTDVKSANISNMLAEKQRKRQAEMDMYKIETNLWATDAFSNKLR